MPVSHSFYKQKYLWLLLPVFATILIRCTEVNVSGYFTNKATGLTTSYSGMLASRTSLVMNDEILQHTDIPLGESFQIINYGVKGLKVKDRRVHVSCSLHIADSNGRVIFGVPDLWEGRGFFHQDSASILRCTINTGAPMQWEENYKITVIFRDMQGKGSIENSVTIRSIDLP